MHTARLLTVSPSMHCTEGGCLLLVGGCLLLGGCLLPGGVCSWGMSAPGGSAPGGCLLPGGWYPSMHWGRHPPRGQNSWHTLLKILPCPKLRLRAIIKSLIKSLLKNRKRRSPLETKKLFVLFKLFAVTNHAMDFWKRLTGQVATLYYSRVIYGIQKWNYISQNLHLECDGQLHWKNKEEASRLYTELLPSRADDMHASQLSF